MTTEPQYPRSEIEANIRAVDAYVRDAYAKLPQMTGEPFPRPAAPVAQEPPAPVLGSCTCGHDEAVHTLHDNTCWDEGPFDCDCRKFQLVRSPTPERVMMDWIDANDVTVRGATPAMLMSVARKALGIAVPVPDAGESFVRRTERAPGSAQEPADPPWLIEAIHAACDAVYQQGTPAAVRAALPILRAGIAAEIEASIGNVVGESHAYCEGKRDAADIVVDDAKRQAIELAMVEALADVHARYPNGIKSSHIAVFLTAAALRVLTEP